MGRRGRRATKALPLAADAFEPAVHPLAEHVALELGEDGSIVATARPLGVDMSSASVIETNATPSVARCRRAAA